MSTIEVSELEKIYSGGVEALRGVSFRVQAGEVFALLGPNGAGKSSTVRILATLSSPSGGTARVAGFDVTAEPQEVRRRIGYVAQSTSVDLTATGRENLSLQGRLFGLRRRELHDRIDGLLEKFHLGETADRLVRTYSGGMKRRLDVAMGLIHSPQILFLDEPTTGLDPESRSVMWAEIRRLAADGGVTILLTTHYLEEADRLAQRLVIIDRGRVVAAGDPEELKGSLRGDLVSIQLTDPSRLPEARDLVARLEGVSQVLVDQDLLYAQVSNGSRAVPAVVGALERAVLLVEQISLSRPSLDEVYLTATGHAYREENVAPRPPSGG